MGDNTIGQATPETRREKARVRAFSLLELSVVLAIIGTLLAGAMVVGLGMLDATRFNMTVERMDAIHRALLNYSTSFSRLPCPSNLTLPDSDANYGIEAANKGTCTGGTPAANFSAASGTVEGGVPTRTLQLPDEYLYDGWGRRFRYAVDPDKTEDASLPVGTGVCPLSKPIAVKDAAATDRTANAVYALVSHGANGHGGYTRSGAVFNAGSTNTDEQTNCHCDATGSATTYSPTYVQKLPTESSTSATDTFDDIATYRDAWQLQTFSAPLSSSACAKYIYVAECGNNRIQKFDIDGNYVGKFGTAGTGDGQFNYPTDVALDSSGSIYVTDSGNNRIQKFDSSGNYISQFGGYGTANGQFGIYYPNGIVIDSNDVIYATDGANVRVQVFNTSGVYQRQIGCASGTCSSGTGNGQLNQYLQGLAIDSANNVYITDGDPTHRVQKFNSSGSYVDQNCSYAYPANNNSCYGLSRIFVDSSGNILLSDNGNNRVKRLNSSYVYQSEYTYGGFNPYGIAVDDDGYIWVVNKNQNRVQKFDSTWTYQNLQLGCASGSCAASSADGGLSGPCGIRIH